jgi:ElaB/YqjD/DUF883 family membrane-anchored ribosome-binding protein
MLKDHEIEKIKQEDEKKLGIVNARADDVARDKAAAIQEKSKSLKERIQKLIDKKHELLTAPLTKSETLELAKEALREGRKEVFFDNVLVPHLRACQQRKYSFLDRGASSLHLLPPEHAWKLLYWVITEKDLLEASQNLPDDGLPEAEREAQIKKVDGEIAALVNQIEKELQRE